MSALMPAARIRCANVFHVYGAAGAEVAALRGVDLTVEPGDTLALLGPSGSGKSTLLWQLAGLLTPTAGLVEIDGKAPAAMTGRERAGWRLREVGIVLQNPARNVLPWETVVGNVLLAQRPTRRSPARKRGRAKDLLESVNLESVATQRAGVLSGGEQQRLSLAIALANGPGLLLADEPTSQLDATSAAAVLDLITAANQELGTTVVAVTHDESVAKAFGRTVTIRDGRIGQEGRDGEDFVVVGRDGTVGLPPDFADVLPPGSLAQATRHDDGVLIRPMRHETDPTR